MAVALAASTFGALHASVLANARIPFAMARDGLFFRKMGEVSPRSHLPVNALLVQGVWASVLAFSGTFDTLTDSVVFASWLFYGLTTASLFVFRRTMPDAERPYRVWGYPVVPLLFPGGHRGGPGQRPGRNAAAGHERIRDDGDRRAVLSVLVTARQGRDSLISAAGVAQPSRLVAAGGVVMRPVNHATALIPLVLTLE